MTGSPNVCAVVTKDTTEMEDGRWEIHTLYAEAAVTKCPVLSLVSDATSTKLQSEQINTGSGFYIAPLRII